MKTTKLIRDKIPEIMKEAGKECKYRVAKDDKEYEDFLMEKVSEEFNEFMEARNVEELIDVITVLKAVIELKGEKVTLCDIVDTYLNKLTKRGEFKKRLIGEFD